MSARSSFEYARRLEEAGIDSKQAAALVEAMEEIVGTPLTQEVFDARNDTLLAELKSFKDSMNDKVDALKMELKLREQAFEKGIEADVVAWVALVARLKAEVIGGFRFLS